MLDDEIAELWELMQISKSSYRKEKKTVHCLIGLKMNNYEGKDSGELQYKVWNTGRLQLVINDDSEVLGQLQTKVSDPGRHMTKRSWFPFTLGVLYRGIPLLLKTPKSD